jgi:hypothetical protein
MENSVTAYSILGETPIPEYNTVMLLLGITHYQLANKLGDYF